MADNKGTFLIRTQCAAVPSYAETGGGGWTMDAVKQMLSNLDPGHVAAVGQAYAGASDALTTAADRLHRHAQRLVEAWTGDNAERALKQLGQLNTTAAELQEKSATTGQVYSWLGSEILPWYKAEGEKMGHGYINDGGDDRAAVELLDRMDNRILQGYNGVPDSINKDLPPRSGSSSYQGTDSIPTSGTSQPGGPASGVPSGAVPGGLPGDSTGHRGDGPTGPGGGIPTGPGTGVPGNSGPGAGVPGGITGLPGSAGGTDLAGAGGAGMDPFGASGIGGGAGGAAGGLGGGPGGLGGGPGVIGGGVLAPGAPGPLGAGRGGSGTTTGGSASRGAGGRPGAGAPMGGGGHGKDEEERERTTWLTEDEDVWTDGGDIAPPLIG